MEKENPFDDIFNKQLNTGDNYEAEDISKIIKEWLNKKYIQLKTRLTKEQVVSITILEDLGDNYKIKTLQKFITKFKINKLSEDSRSSDELVKILTSRNDYEEEGNPLKAWSKLLDT